MSKENIVITLPDGSKKDYQRGTTGMEIAMGISEGLARNVLSVQVDDEIWDASRPINSDADVKLLTWNDEGGKYAFWHSSAHLMAEALESLYPGIKFGIGPPIENGFYYDVDFGDMDFSADDLPKVEAKMKELAQQKNVFERQEISKTEAIKFFKKKGDEYKVELLEDLEDGRSPF